MESISKLTNECFNDVDWDLLNPKNPGTLPKTNIAMEIHLFQ